MIAQQLPALQVVVPLLAAPLIVLAGRLNFAWALATLASWASFAVALVLAARVLEEGTISYAMGSWAPPWGIELRIDMLGAFVLVLVSGISAVVMPYARRSVAAELPRSQEYLFYALWCLCLAGLLGMVLSGDAFNIFVFLEVSSLSMYVLIALGARRQALAAAYQYLLMGTLGATFYVIGVGLLYLVTGTLNLADLSVRLPQVADARPLIAALAFITVGIGLKLALFPLHQWLPNAYAYAPSAVTAFIAATATKVSVYVLLRYYFTVFGQTLHLGDVPFDELLLVLSLAAIFAMSIVALFQQDLKRMFAYSSVAQVGYMTLGIAIGSAAGMTGAVSHLFNHGITKGAIFLLLGGLALRCGGSTRLADLSGIASRMPLTAFGLVLAGLSLIGIPGTAGFVTKWYLIKAALEQGWWWLAALIVASSLIAIGYVWRFVENAYLQPVSERAPREGEAPLSMLVPAWLLVAACVWFGFETSFNVGYAQQAIENFVQEGD